MAAADMVTRGEVARRNVIVTGGGGGEKNAVAHAIVSAHSATHAPVALDAYRYVDAHWTKAPAAEFRERVATRILTYLDGCASRG
jgi:hypothetical protein